MTTTDQMWAAGIMAVTKESAGVVDVFVIDSATCAELLAAGLMGGDDRSLALYQAVDATAKRITHAPRRSPPLCICCPRSIKRITRATIFGLAVPATANPEAAIGFAFCTKCGTADRGTLQAKATEGLRRIWPDLKQFVVTHPTGGHG
jgi:hypothetical protein